MPEPPATVEVGPNIAASSADQTWLPGCWVWQQNRYAWRPGFWATVEPDWVWVPAHYVWAPRGYVFVDGYWDYSIARRGVLFAPVYFNSNVYARRGFSYSPRTVIDLGVFASHLFMRPQYQHYYFGDYYAANYRGAGFHPWFSINTGRSGYDPIYAHQRWQHRRDRGWEQRQHADFENRRDHENLRPPRTWSNQGEMGAGGVASLVRNIVGASLDQESRSRNDAWRFQPVDQAERQRLHQHGQEVYRFRDQRQQWETNLGPARAADPGHRGKPGRMRLPPSPITAKSADQLGKGHAPPRIYEAPQPDPRVAAKPRVNRSQGQPRQRTVKRMPLDQPRTQPQAAPKVEPPAPRTRRQPQAKGASRPRGNSTGANQDKPKEKPKDKPKEKPKKKPEDTPKNKPKGKDK